MDDIFGDLVPVRKEDHPEGRSVGSPPAGESVGGHAGENGAAGSSTVVTVSRAELAELVSAAASGGWAVGVQLHQVGGPWAWGARGDTCLSPTPCAHAYGPTTTTSPITTTAYTDPSPPSSKSVTNALSCPCPHTPGAAPHATCVCAGAVEASFSRLAKSLRSVLEDMSKRLEEGMDVSTELRSATTALSQQLEQSSTHANARFTAVDMAVRWAWRVQDACV
jgi:hypothetical protein